MSDTHSSKRRRKRHSRGRIPEERLSHKGASLFQSRLRVYTLPLFLFLVVLAGGGMPVWAQAIVLIVGGVWGLKQPPRGSPDRNIDLAIIGLLVSACLAFLPGALFGRPAWWSSAHNLGIDLPMTVTPQPLVALEGLLMLLGGLLWFYHIWHLKLEGDDHRRVLWFFSFGTAIMALAVSIGTYANVTYPLGKGASVFSFFDNRNQMATLLVMGGLVSFAMAMQGIRKARFRGMMGLINTLVIFTGLAFCESRAGIILFCFGGALWFLIRLRVSKVDLVFKAGVPVLLACMALLFIFGQQTMERFSLWSVDNPTEMAELRVAVYQDAIKMAAKQPIAGVGLGSFEAVFPQYRDKSAVSQSIRHPESDWVWVLTETGVTGAFFLTIGVLFIILRLFPVGNDATAPLRAAALIAFLVFLIHSLFDVPGHRLGTILFAMLMFRLAAPYKKRQKLPIFGQRWWRAVAGVSLLGGTVWLAAYVFNLPIQSRIITENARQVVESEYATQNRDADKIIDALNSSISVEPLSWWAYSTRANTRLSLKRDNDGARDDFRRARFLEKFSSEVSFFEGKAWLNYSNQYAFAAWRDAINREDPNQKDLFRKMLEASLRYPRFNKDLAQLTRFNPDFRYYYLMRLKGKELNEQIMIDVGVSPRLTDFTDEQKADLFEQWALYGDPLLLLDHFRDYPGVVPAEWFYRSLAYANNSDYDVAVNAMVPHLKPVKVQPIPLLQYAQVSLDEHKRLYSNSPNDVARGLALLDKQVAINDYEGALLTATLMTKQQDVPTHVYYWKGELHRKLGQSKDAWDAWYKYYTLRRNSEYTEQFIITDGDDG